LPDDQPLRTRSRQSNSVTYMKADRVTDSSNYEGLHRDRVLLHLENPSSNWEGLMTTLVSGKFTAGSYSHENTRASNKQRCNKQPTSH
jgi:hypothetical protein